MSASPRGTSSAEPPVASRFHSVPRSNEKIQNFSAPIDRAASSMERIFLDPDGLDYQPPRSTIRQLYSSQLAARYIRYIHPLGTTSPTSEGVTLAFIFIGLFNELFLLLAAHLE